MTSDSITEQAARIRSALRELDTVTHENDPHDPIARAKGFLRAALTNEAPATEGGLRVGVQRLIDNQQSWTDNGRSGQAISRDAVRDTLQRLLDETPAPATEDEAAEVDPEVEAAINEADTYMTEHRVTDSWRVIRRLRDVLVRASR